MFQRDIANSENYEEIVTNSDKPVLIEFWARWCGPCRIQLPVIEELSNEIKNSAIIAKLDIEKNPELASKFSIMSIPSLVLIKNKKVVYHRTGVTSKPELHSILKSVNT